MVPPSGAGALLRNDGLQEKRATKATLNSLLVSSHGRLTEGDSHARQETVLSARAAQRVQVLTSLADARGAAR